MENKPIKTRNTIIAICLFVIAILLILLILLRLNSNIKKNNLQSQIDELEITNEENDNTFNTIEEDLSTKETNPLNNILLTQEPINTDNIYGFANKEELIDDQYNYTLVAINKNDNSEMPIMNFSSGAYDYFDNKIYFYNEKDDEMSELKKGFYMIDLDKSKSPNVQEVYLIANTFAYLDSIEYHNEKLYYTANGYLYCLDINNKDIEKLDTIANYMFDINNETNMLYYTNDNYNFCEMNLLTGEVTVIHERASVEYLAEDKLIYHTDDMYYEYDFNEKIHKKITDCWGGTIGKSNIVRDNGDYIYIDTEARQIIKQSDDDQKQFLVNETGYEALTILSDNKILLERNEAIDYGEDYHTYIYDMKKNEITQTLTNYRYSYMKKIK